MAIILLDVFIALSCNQCHGFCCYVDKIDQIMLNLAEFSCKMTSKLIVSSGIDSKVFILT